MAVADALVNKKDVEIQMSERALRDQSTKIEKLQEKCAVTKALEAKIAALEKVNPMILYKLCITGLTITL